MTIEGWKSDLAPGVMKTYWSFVISNNGDRTVSITSFEVLAEVLSGNYPSFMQYSGLYDGTVFNRNLHVETLPVSIESGKSVEVLLPIGVMIDPAAAKIIRRGFLHVKHKVMLNDVLCYLRDRGRDPFGNQLKQLVSASQNGHPDYSSGFIMPPFDQLKQPAFYVTAMTGRKSHFHPDARWYGFLEEQFRH